jgi:AraC-like DNA-binding protein
VPIAKTQSATTAALMVLSVMEELYVVRCRAMFGSAHTNDRVQSPLWSSTSVRMTRSPKVLWLHEARRLMLDAGSAGRQVGYLSASQFSREYTRLFGSAPTRDIARLRDDGVAGDGTR